MQNNGLYLYSTEPVMWLQLRGLLNLLKRAFLGTRNGGKSGKRAQKTANTGTYYN